MSSPINEKTLEYLAQLARVELTPHEEEKLLKDLKRILDYFNELRELDTSNVAPMAGGTELKSVFRTDEEREGTNRGEGIDQFPETHRNFLKVPPVFE